MKKNIYAIYYILILALFLRLFGINESFWLDEATTGLVVRNLSFSDIISKFSPYDFHPPLHYLLLKAWSSVFGWSEIALRSISVLFGVMNVWVVYKIGVALGDKTLGKLSAILLATSPLHIYYSVEARMYAMVTFLVSYFILEFIKLINIEKTKFKQYLILGLLGGLIFLTDYLGVLILLSVVTYFITNKEQLQKHKAGFSLVLAILLIVVGAWMSIFLRQLSLGISVQSQVNEWWKILGTLSFKNMLLIPIKFSIGRIGFDNKIVYGIIISFVLGVYSYLMLMSTLLRLKNKNVIYFWLFIPIFGAFLISSFFPILTYFRFLFLIPAFYIVISMGLIKSNHKMFLPLFVLALLINVFGLIYYQQNEKFHREDWKALTAYISENAKENSSVIFVSNSQMEGYRYYDYERKLDYGIEAVKPGLDEIYLLRYVWNIFDPEDKVREKVEESYEFNQNLNFNGVVVYKYIKKE